MVTEANSTLKTIDSITEESDLFYYEIIPNMVSFIQKHWNVSTEPKNYVEYLKTYEEYDTMDEGVLDKMYDEADFPIDKSSGQAFVCRTAINNVAYGDTEQGVKPFETLIGSVWAYGTACGKRREELSSKKRTDRLDREVERSERHLKESEDKLSEVEAKYLLALQKIKEMSDFEDVSFGDKNELVANTEIEILEEKKRIQSLSLDELIKEKLAKKGFTKKQ
jgi:hypothetical protein